jgi:hypothetical protein
MLKIDLRWVTTLHGNLTHLIFVQSRPSKVDRPAWHWFSQHRG